jgi:hypothetical protein
MRKTQFCILVLRREMESEVTINAEIQGCTLDDVFQGLGSFE